MALANYYSSARFKCSLPAKHPKKSCPAKLRPPAYTASEGGQIWDGTGREETQVKRKFSVVIVTKIPLQMGSK